MDTVAIEEESQQVAADQHVASPALARDCVRFHVLSCVVWASLVVSLVALDSSELNASPLRYLRILAVFAVLSWYADARSKLRGRLAMTFGQTTTRALLDWNPSTKMEGWLVSRLLTLRATYGNDHASDDSTADDLASIEARRDRDRWAIMLQSLVPLFLAMLLIALAANAGLLRAGETTTRGLIVLAIAIPSLIALPRVIRLCRCWGI